MLRPFEALASHQRSHLIVVAVLSLIPVILGASATQAADQVRPNTLRTRPLAPGDRGSDIIKLRTYDHVGSPACTRDGRSVAFDAYKVVSSVLVSPAELFIVRIDGTGLSRLTAGCAPRWSPDGKRLLFMREGQGDPEKDLGIFVIDRDGSGERRIGPGRWPDWSPDGSRIAYSLGGEERGGARARAKIYIARLDGSGRRSLCDGDCPSWSPDGRKIACCLVDSDRRAPEIRVVDVETGRAAAIGPGWYRPDWSPDGKSLICDGMVDQDQVMVRLRADDPHHAPEPLPTPPGRGTSPCFAGTTDAIVYVEDRSRTEAGDPSHTLDGRYDTSTIELTVVYLVPKDRRPLVDWRERVDYFMGRIAAFHRRESGGRSNLRIHIHPEPLAIERTARQVRGGDPDQTFENSTREARRALGWPRAREGFPILLVLSDINWRELDDFRRTILVDGRPRFEGSVDEHGRHFPGAESGGARAAYLPDEGIGLGLVSADGWRVPYSGSDCVVYHEGIGHPLGLLHPEPEDDSVMGLAQYKYWLNQTWVDGPQKRALGWSAPAGAGAIRPTGRDDRRDLFTAFTALPSPTVPKPREPVMLRMNWPEGARLRELKVRLQTDLQGPWLALPLVSTERPLSAVELGSFDRPTPVSYRVDAALVDGQSVELWGYFKVESPN
jgi:hypothetical protein